MKSKTSALLPLIAVLLIFTGCSSTWILSDDSAVKLVKSYYLFYHEGREVDAVVTDRRGIIKDCKCLPIVFQIKTTERGEFRKTFYFLKNGSGKPEIRESKFGALRLS